MLSLARIGFAARRSRARDREKPGRKEYRQFAQATLGGTHMEEVYNYVGYQWLSVREGMLVIGINEEGVEEFSEVTKVDLPSPGDEVFADEVLGEIETDQGPLNLYSPFDGVIGEVNEMVQENPDLVMEDPTGDGWLLAIEPNSPEDLDTLGQATTNDVD
ncbi:MAG: glycine cleavage system protein H [Bdellovibrionales bacterium]|nr:glycine cleavage system protein H [Bdellovibrionales bacterium]